MFKIGEYVVYQRNVCKISALRKIYNNQYYVMHPIDDLTLTIQVPVNNPLCQIRKIVSKEETEKLISKISEVPVIQTTERMMENKYKELLSSGHLEDLICIIKTTYMRNYNRKKNGKKIGEIDDTYFHLAEKLLYNELSICLHMNFDDTKEYVVSTVKKVLEKNEA